MSLSKELKIERKGKSLLRPVHLHMSQPLLERLKRIDPTATLSELARSAVRDYVERFERIKKD